jgi:hypothetical protein
MSVQSQEAILAGTVDTLAIAILGTGFCTPSHATLGFLECVGSDFPDTDVIIQQTYGGSGFPQKPQAEALHLLIGLGRGSFPRYFSWLKEDLEVEVNSVKEISMDGTQVMVTSIREIN